MIVLDRNVQSELMRPAPYGSVVDWTNEEIGAIPSDLSIDSK